MRRESPRLAGKKLFVNLSAATLEDADFMRGLPELMAEHEVEPGSLVFEITERGALRHLAGLAKLMRDLDEQGVHFALDDFGSGFSSFLYLKYFPVQYVKIEGSFGRSIAENDRDRLMVEHIHAVSCSLGMRTIVEWIEDEPAHQVAANVGIDLAQGYHYGRPALWQVDADEDEAAAAS